MSLPHFSFESFARRHIGPSPDEVAAMLRALGVSSLQELVEQTVPKQIRSAKALQLPPALTERQLVERLEAVAAKNEVVQSLIGAGYSDCITPPVIARNILENPGWYTQYTPYQAEIAQGRLEALLNFQTMVIDLTGLEVANASLLDEATAAAEAMAMAHALKGAADRNVFLVASDCHPQTIDVVRTRARPLGIEVRVAEPAAFELEKRQIFGALLQYPATDGAVRDDQKLVEELHAAGALVVMAADILSLALLRSPGELGADVAVGSTQRFGVPLGFGGPHAGYFATRAAYTRSMPGRIIGVSEDARGLPALRMALQTREQHIRREKATSNICTAQVLLAVISSMYAVYHGPQGIRAIAERAHRLAAAFAKALARQGHQIRHATFFDTVRIDASPSIVDAVIQAALARKMNLRRLGEGSICVAFDETSTQATVEGLLEAFAQGKPSGLVASELQSASALPESLRRKSAYLQHPVFNTYHSETEMLRYMRRLESKDLSLTHSMIPLGSCTMKLNGTTEMLPITWPQFARLHPFAPAAQTSGYQEIFRELSTMLAEVTGLPGVSLQPNAGSQGEYAGLLVIRAYHDSRKEAHRKVCLIPQSAHGTNPATAVMAGYQVVVVKCDPAGNIELPDLEAKAREHAQDLAALMVTYPSTHGVFEEDIKRICAVIHQYGGQVYMDGANLNAQVGLCRPGEIGADVCHINLHKTFCIPHGGGGPGMGPIAVASHLKAFLPGHSVVKTGGADAIGAVSAAPWGSASILLISWAYISMMGGEGLTTATEVAILNANYVAEALHPHYPVLYRGKRGRVAHECILDLRPLKKLSGVEVEDVAKRLIDYGFHAPTVSFPVAGTLMIEPTESESKDELDRFIEAMVSIRREIAEIEQGISPKENNLLKNAPHTADVLVADAWDRPYARERAAFPTPATRRFKFWPSVARLNGVLGDRRLICACPPIEAYQPAEQKRAAG